MTKQQVIDILEAYKPSGNIYNGYDSIEEKVDKKICSLIDEIINSVKREADDDMDDLISRQGAIDACKHAWAKGLEPSQYIEILPSAQSELLSDAYTKAVWTWLIDYQIKVAELKGRYTPYEVLLWVLNDWRKEHERSD